MSKIEKIINRLSNLIALKPACPADILNVELELALPLAADYKEYLLKFGAVLADDIELTGIAKSKHRNVILVTKREWEANNKMERNMYVIENVGIDGIVVWQDGSGKVYESRPNYGATKIADSIVEYLETKVKE